MENRIAITSKKIAENLNSLGDKVAIVIDGETFTYEFLKQKVSPLTKDIVKYTEKDEYIGLHLQNNINCYIGLISIILSGRAFVPINEGFGVDQSIFMLKTGNVSKAIQSAKTKEFEKIIDKMPLMVFQTEQSSDEEIEFVNSKNAYLLFTSGSTGHPKGVPISHLNLDSFIEGMVNDDAWSMNSEDRFLQPFNLSFDLFVFTVYLPLYLGATFLTVPLNKISLYSAALLKEENITISLLVPSTMKIINKISSSLTFKTLRLSFFCGEALYASDLKNWIQCTPNAKQINIYGPTEATVAFSKYVWNGTSDEEVKNDIVPIGVPFGKNLLGLLDTETNETELLLGGPQVFHKYIGTEKDPFVIINGINFYRTGDICELNEKGNYLFIGRNDGQVKVDGYRIEISDVENKLKNIFPEREIIVIHYTNDEKLSSLHAFLTGDAIINFDKKIESQIPDYMRPASHVFVKAIPLNMNGKTDRNKLRSML